MPPSKPRKRETDQQIISQWIDNGSRVLDVGCGRGILLEQLIRTKEIQGLGVDSDFSKIASCVHRKVPAYHGDADKFLREFPDHFFDWIILSRTIQELANPGDFLSDALRAARHVAVGFENHGYWKKRIHFLMKGSRKEDSPTQSQWASAKPQNSVSVQTFQEFCNRSGIRISNSVFLNGTWQKRRRKFPNLFAGYALFHLEPPPAKDYKPINET